MSITCEHGHLARVCEICDRDKTIADLREAVRVLAELHSAEAFFVSMPPLYAHADKIIDMREKREAVKANEIAAEAVRKAGG